VIIFRYLSKEIINTLLAATLILLVIFMTNQSTVFLQRAAAGQLPTTVLLQLMILYIPLLLPYLLPLGLYLGILLTLSRMHAELEMTVLSACGVSRVKLMAMILMIAVVVASVVAWLMASVVPNAQGQINYIAGKTAVSASVAQVIPGQFMRFDQSGQQVVFYADHAEKHQVMNHVFMARKTRAESSQTSTGWDIIVADKAMEKKNYHHEGDFVIFDHGYRYTGTPGEKKYQVMQFDEYGIRLNPDKIPTYNAVQYYSFSKLWSLSPSHLDAAGELQWRLAMPISVLIFSLMAAPLSEVRPRFGKFTQLFPAILIYAVYADFIFLTRDWIQSGKLSPVWGMWWVHGAMLLLAMLLMWYRTHWRSSFYQ